MSVELKEKALRAKSIVPALAVLTAEAKNNALKEIASRLMADSDRILKANRSDILAAEKSGLASPLLKRLQLDKKKIESLCEGIAGLIRLDDPVGKTLQATELEKGFELYKVTCPIGVIGIIFESRPDALVQISTLCLKSGNAVILKGGREALETNKVLTEIIGSATGSRGIPAAWIHLLETREDVNEMLNWDDCIDLIIPRGSNEFVRYIMAHTNIPVLGHAEGICHLYVDEEADLPMAIKVAVDSKTQYVAVCNAMETLLVHSSIARKFLPELKKEFDKKNVEIRGCDATRSIIPVKPADEADWKTEYLDYIISIKIVDSLGQAIDHINRYGSKHTDSIITGNKATALTFMNLVDTANAFWNCSTRFSDGFRYGLGAEVGISTNKIHARGPVGLEGLVIYKWLLFGQGQTVADFATGGRKFTHIPLDKKVPS
jgi:glutamate-5-semialdehyde dehydrogenase